MGAAASPAPDPRALGTEDLTHYFINPLLGLCRTDTLESVEYALAFLSRFHSDHSDWLYQEELQNTAGPGPMTFEEAKGLALLTECVRSAVRYEIQRGES